MPTLPEPTRTALSLARLQGHEPVSQGCALFRCTRCDERGFLPGRLGSHERVERILGEPCNPTPGA